VTPHLLWGEGGGGKRVVRKYQAVFWPVVNDHDGVAVGQRVEGAVPGFPLRWRDIRFHLCYRYWISAVPGVEVPLAGAIRHEP
jgi:hypothetical protein